MPTMRSDHFQPRGADASAVLLASGVDREEPEPGDRPAPSRGRSPVPPPPRPEGGIYRALRDAIMRNLRDESDRPWE
jgi:hypothetical protein